MSDRFTYAMRKGVDESLPELAELFSKENEEKKKFFDAMSVKLGERISGKSDEEIATPDTFGCECLFLSRFYTRQMGKDLSFIAREFLMNGFKEIDFDRGIVEYIKAGSADWSVKVGMYYRLLNLMWNAVKQGSEYAKNFFLYLYKTYYRKEYKQLKRFRTISTSEINAISAKNPDDKDVFAVARVFTMSQLMGIEVNDVHDRFFKYAVLSEYYEKWIEGDEEEGDRYSLDMDECEDDTAHERAEIVERYHISTKSAMQYLKKVQKYIDYVRDNDCGRAAGFIFDLPDEGDVILGLGETLAELKDIFGVVDLTDREIILFWALDCVVSFANDNCRHYNMMIEEILLGKVIDKSHHKGEPAVLFDPEEMRKGVFRLDQGGSEAKNKKEAEHAGEQTEELSSDREKALVNEIEELRRKLHLQEGEIRGLKAEMSEMKKIMTEKEKLAAENSGMRTELAALRNHVYNLTEKEEQADTVTVDDMKAVIRDKRIIIIGGDINWVNKMKLEFPEWTYVKPANSGTMDTKIVEKADKVYFFTDTIDHGTYYRYCNVVRECGTPFGYIHGVNIGNITRQLYKELD